MQAIKLDMLNEIDRANALALGIDVLHNNPPYRTVRPANAENMVRKEQEDAWIRHV